jgi:hypothetical protein
LLLALVADCPDACCDPEAGFVGFVLLIGREVVVLFEVNIRHQIGFFGEPFMAL